MLVGEPGGEVVVVDALPGLVGGAPGAAVAAVVEVGGSGRSVGVGLDVVALVVAYPAAVAAVEIHEVGGGDDDAVAEGSGVVDVGDAVVPGLDDDVLGDFAGGGGVGGEDDIVPHDEGLVGLLLEVGDGAVDPDLVEVAHGVVLGEELASEAAEVVAVHVELVAANVEPVVGEDPGELLVHFAGDFVGLVVEDVELARVGLDGGMGRPVVVRPPGVDAGQDALVNLFPARASVTGHIDFRDNADTTGSSIADDFLEDILAVDLIEGIGIFGHVGVSLEFYRPGLGIHHVPVENVELGKSHAVELLKDLLLGKIISAGINHDTTNRV